MAGMAGMMRDRFLSGTVSLVLWGAWALSVAIGLIAWAQAAAERHRLVWTLRTVAVVVGLWSVLMLVGAASGGDSALQPLADMQGTAAGPDVAHYHAAFPAKTGTGMDTR